MEFLVEAYHSVYRIPVGHEDIGSLWAVCDLNDTDFSVHISYQDTDDSFELSGPHSALMILAEFAMREGEASGRLRYVRLSKRILGGLEDSMEDQAEKARWN